MPMVTDESQGISDPACSESPDESDKYDQALCDAINHTHDWYKAYLKAGGNPTNARSAITAITLPAAAVAAFYGITGHGSSDRVARLSIGAATVFGLGTALAGKEKQKVYLEGARAMNCLLVKSVPGMIKHGPKIEVETKLGDVEAALASTASFRNLSQDESKLLAEAKTIQGAARELLRFLRTLPIELRLRTNDIATEVSKQVVEVDPDISSLAAIAASIRPMAQMIGGTSLTAADAAQVTETQAGAVPEDESGRTQKLRELAEAAEALRQVIHPHLETHLAFAQIESCKPVMAPQEFTVVPGGAALSIDQGSSLQLSITDSSGFPSARVSGKGSDAIEISPFTVAGGSLVLTLEGLKPTGSEGPTLTIRNGSGNRVHSVQILVASTEPPPDKDGQDEGTGDIAQESDVDDEQPSGTRNEVEQEIFQDPANILRLQCLVGLSGKDTDCKMGPTTRRAISEFRDDGLDVVDHDLLEKTGGIEILRACSDEDPACRPKPDAEQPEPQEADDDADSG